MRALVLAALLLSSALWGAVPAQAHAFLHSASPAVGATVRAAPPAVEIVFTAAVEPSFSTIEVRDAGGRRVDRGDVHAPGGDGERLAVSLVPVPPGTYTVTWHATAVDTHRTEGSFAFTVAP